MFYSLLILCLGASLGAIMRWSLSLILNGLITHINISTLVANLIGCYLVGIALVAFTTQPSISSEWKLFIVTGFLGSFTTFSSFSAEIIILLRSGHHFLAMGNIALHVVGSLMMTALGLGTFFLFSDKVNG